MPGIEARPQERLEQPGALLVLPPRHCPLDLLGGQRDEGRVVGAEDVDQPGQVHDAHHPIVEGVADRDAGAAPGLDPGTEMLGCVHEHRLAGPQCRADAVGADHALVPDAAHLEVDPPPVLERLLVADGLDDHAVVVGQDQHGLRALEQPADAGERVVRSVAQLAAGVAQLVEPRLVLRQRRRTAGGVDRAERAAMPRLLDQWPNMRVGPRLVVALGDEALPCAHDRALVIVDPAMRARGQ